jgi:hypothetical protein
MKSLFFFASLLFVSASVTSCKKDVKGCTDEIAENYSADATVDDNSCTYFADRFTGNYLGVKTAQIYQSDSNFTFYINRIADKEDQISLEQFPETGVSTIANIDFSSPNQIIIPNQHLENALDISEISGTGTLNGNQLTIRYYRFVNQGIDTTDVLVTK